MRSQFQNPRAVRRPYQQLTVCSHQTPRDEHKWPLISNAHTAARVKHGHVLSQLSHPFIDSFTVVSHSPEGMSVVRTVQKFVSGRGIFHWRNPTINRKLSRMQCSLFISQSMFRLDHYTSHCKLCLLTNDNPTATRRGRTVQQSNPSLSDGGFAPLVMLYET